MVRKSSKGTRATDTDKPPKEEERILAIPCIHIPYHSRERLAVALADAREWATRAVVLGDFNDAYTVSDFDRDPGRKNTLHDERTMVQKELFDPLEEAELPTDVIVGNHEQRIPRYINKNAPALSCLPELELSNFYGIPKYKHLTMYPRSGFKRWGIRWKHGDRVSKEAGETAKAEMKDHRCSGVSAHTHRKGEATFRDKEGRFTWWVEAGHLCDESKAEYVNSPNWNPGYYRFTLDPNGDVKREFVDLS